MNKQRESKFEVDLAGVDRYVAETTLTITDRYSGDNYCVRATLQNPGDQPFDTVSGMTGNAPIVIPSIKATRNLVAWRRYYLRRARMYTKGCTIVDENPSGKATVSVDSVSDVSVGEWVTVFWRGKSCERRIRSITSGTTIRLEGGDGSGAEPIYLLSNGSITHVGLADKGSGYTDAPSVVVEGGNPNNPAIIKASLQPTTVGRIVMTSGGSGYTSPPTVMYNGDGMRYVIFVE